MQAACRRVVVLALGVMLTAAWSIGNAGAAQTTSAKIYKAFTPHGNSTFRTRTRRGSCFNVSLVTQRRDAWRCTRASILFDPCFSSSKRKGIVLCPDAPWLGTGVKITLTKPLPKAGKRPGASLSLQPWALETYDGRQCRLISGATRVTDGERLNYGCAENEDPLWGFPDRSTQPWTIFTAQFDAEQLTDRATLRRAWM
jgi:hypothetical protein